MDMKIWVTIYMFVIGAAFGSFALAMVDRMKSGKDWVRGRSECDDCGHRLSAIDLIPIVSWVLAAGKCRYCSIRLSRYYPLVETVSGMVFAASYYVLSDAMSSFAETAMFALWLFGVVVMTALAVFDLRWYLLPNKLIYPLIGASFVHWTVGLLANHNQSNMQYVLMGAVSTAIGWGLFFALHRISKGKWIGDGDYRLGAAIGLFLGSPLLTWLSLFLASIAGLFAALVTHRRGQSIKKVKIPFGPFLMFGLLVSYLWGQQLIDWYSSTFLYL